MQKVATCGVRVEQIELNAPAVLDGLAYPTLSVRTGAEDPTNLAQLF